MRRDRRGWKQEEEIFGIQKVSTLSGLTLLYREESRHQKGYQQEGSPEE